MRDSEQCRGSLYFQAQALALEYANVFILGNNVLLVSINTKENITLFFKNLFLGFKSFHALVILGTFSKYSILNSALKDKLEEHVFYQ